MKKFSDEKLKKMGFVQVLGKAGSARGTFYFLFIFVFLLFGLVLLTGIPRFLDFPEERVGRIIIIATSISFIVIFYIFIRMVVFYGKKYKELIKEKKKAEDLIKEHVGELILVLDDSVGVITLDKEHKTTLKSLKIPVGAWIALLDVNKHQEVLQIGIACAGEIIKEHYVGIEK